MTAHFPLNRAFKHAGTGVVTPYQHSLLVWAIVFGAVLFTGTPRPAMLLGAGLIVASGLFIARVSPLQGRCAPVVVR